MKNEMHRHLDGDIAANDLAADDQKEADEWDRMVAAFRISAPNGGMPPWLEQRVMAEVEAIPERGPIGRLIEWLVNPATIRVPPLAAGLAGAAMALLVMLRGVGIEEPAIEAPAPIDAVVYVQFILDAPTATSVAVAGDFSEWEASFALEDTDGDGVWTGRIPVEPGVHAYMFLVDGTDWETDPRADRYREDGFGNRNAVLAVAAGV